MISEFDFSDRGKALFWDEGRIGIFRTVSTRVMLLITTRCSSRGSQFKLINKSFVETSSSSVSPENICTPLHLNFNPSEKPQSRNSIFILSPVAWERASVIGPRKVFRLTDRNKIISRTNRLAKPIANFSKSPNFFGLRGGGLLEGTDCFFPE